ncbi:MAG: hypothetical protein GPJ54_07075 [Candidatus Heimdallarchaeota archaeon]|nr:hypothetical protein [Candidatus Heimdallarchaeota archaeon]
MKVLIGAAEKEPSQISNPSTLIENSKSYVIYDAADDSVNFVPSTFDIKQILKLGVTDIVTSKINEDFYYDLKKAGITVWNLNSSVTIKESYQSFVLGGTFVLDTPNHSSVPSYRDKEESRVKEERITQLN